MKVNTRHLIISYVFVSLIIPSIFLAFFPGKVIGIVIISCYPIILFFVLRYVNFFSAKFDGRFIVMLYFISGLLILVRGVIGVESYEDFLHILNPIIPMVLFFPLIIYWGLSVDIVFKYFQWFITIIVFASFVLYLQKDVAAPGYTFSHAQAPIYIFIIFFPYLKSKRIFFILILALILFTYDITLRSNMLNVLMAFFISLSFYFRNLIFTLQFLKFVRVSFLFLPFIFFTLGVLNIFNIFLIGEYLGEFVLKNKKGADQEVFVDSRTFLYSDVLTDIAKENAYLFGLGGSGKTQTILVDAQWGEFDVIYKDGRRASEAGMLNYIQWGGFFSAFVYFLLFWKSSYLAIYKSKNWFFKMIGVWISYKFLFSFIDDRIDFNNSTFLLMLLIGMCFNVKLRNLSNSRLKVLINSVFYKPIRSKFSV